MIKYSKNIFKWLVLCAMIGIAVGSASALFLYLLGSATAYREANMWLVALLPLGGLAIGLAYYYWGESVVKGNNQLLEEFHSPRKIIPFKMAPLVLMGTVVTHFFGGSAGREGTAVQMGGAIADQFTRWFRLSDNERKIVLIMGISAGFASIFGTPLAGAVFAVEVMMIGRLRLEALVPSAIVAFVANWSCSAWGAVHSHYYVPFVPEITVRNVALAVVAGAIFGVVAMLFSRSIYGVSRFFGRIVKYPPLRPFFGGILIALAIWMLGGKYAGLGLPVISDAFTADLPRYDFIIKLLLTALTLGSGFKGGEVTPLFFIGATLGNALVWILPLPVALMAAMGFVAVFAGATNTPIACTIMGIELFGLGCGVFIGIACVVAYFTSGHTGIYRSQMVGRPKHWWLGVHRGKALSEIRNGYF